MRNPLSHGLGIKVESFFSEMPLTLVAYALSFSLYSQFIKGIKDVLDNFSVKVYAQPNLKSLWKMYFLCHLPMINQTCKDNFPKYNIPRHQLSMKHIPMR